MSNGIIGNFKMYDENGNFISPNPEIEYDWPSDEIVGNNKKVTNWNTWMRAFSYWLRDKLNFTVSSGPGTTMGKIGRLNTEREVYNLSTDSPRTNLVESAYIDNNNNLQYNLPDNQNNQMDNDWTNENYGLYPLSNGNDGYADWENYRAPSPFRPLKIERGKDSQGVSIYDYYYTDGPDENGKLKWTGKWLGTETFDDINNRFDIILNSNNFDNLGFRVKYPLTTTSTRTFSMVYRDTSSSDQPFSAKIINQGQDVSNIITIRPCLTLTKNNIQIVTKKITDFKGYLGYIDNYVSSGFISPVLKTESNEKIFLKEYFCTLGNEDFSYRYRIHTYSGENWESSVRVPLNERYSINKEGKYIGLNSGSIENVRPLTLKKRQASYRSLIGFYRSNDKYSIYLTDDYNLSNKDEDAPSFRDEPQAWIPSIEDNLNNVIKNELFSGVGKNYNTIIYYKSIDSTVLYITICPENDAKKGIELLFYKNTDNTSNCLMSESYPQKRNNSACWMDKDNHKDYIYNVPEGTRKYGNICGLAVTSSPANDSDPDYIVTPRKDYKDIRDGNTLVDTTGLWRLEKFSLLGKEAKDLYRVSYCGTADKISSIGKRILCKIKTPNETKQVKFFIFPFNNLELGEDDFDDTSTLFAIPIEETIISNNS